MLSKPHTLDLRSDNPTYAHTLLIRPCQVQVVWTVATSETQDFFLLEIYLIGGKVISLEYETSDDNLEEVSIFQDKVRGLATVKD